MLPLLPKNKYLAQLSSTFVVVQMGAAQELKVITFLVLSVLPALKIEREILYLHEAFISEILWCPLLR